MFVWYTCNILLQVEPLKSEYTERLKTWLHITALTVQVNPNKQADKQNVKYIRGPYSYEMIFPDFFTSSNVAKISSDPEKMPLAWKPRPEKEEKNDQINKIWIYISNLR